MPCFRVVALAGAIGAATATCGGTETADGGDAPDGGEIRDDGEQRDLPPHEASEVCPPLETPAGEWPMAGANPQRTSRTTEEVRGRLQVLWYRPFEAYIQNRTQLVAAGGRIYVSTSRGLYALRADSGEIDWVYPTAMPLGHSPTVIDGVAYVGGYDRRLHAVDAATGRPLWTFEAGAGFATNPLVVGCHVYAGSRDGTMYAVYNDGHPRRGELAWSYATGGPILFSAAYRDGVIVFASEDQHAYALWADSGELLWRSEKLPAGNGFHSWWPVVAGDLVVLPGSRGYRPFTPPGLDNTPWAKGDDELFDGLAADEPVGATLPDGTLDMTAALDYLEQRPWRRSYFLLDFVTGAEWSTDRDGDGRPEYAPLLNTGTNSGNRYPPAVGADGRLYTFNHYLGLYGHVAAWTPGAASIDVLTDGRIAYDEPLAYSIGGNVAYWNHCCDRSAGGFDIATGERWTYFEYNLDELIPGYDALYAGTDEARAVAVFGGWNGVYGTHGDQNPPVPYAGRVYLHRSNVVIAWAPAGAATALPLAGAEPAEALAVPSDAAWLQERLSAEVRKIVEAGHLRPGFGNEGGFCLHGRSRAGDQLCDYWHNPADTIYVLTRALPHLPADLQASLRTYLQREFADYPPYEYTSVGWSEGAAREWADLMPEVQADLGSYPATMWSTFDFPGWTGPDWKWTPHTFYALWKYAEAFGGAREIFEASRERLWTPPADDVLLRFPFALNAWIAGHVGYLELERLAGLPESADKRATLDRLLALRVSGFAKDNPVGPDSHDATQVLSVARNFMFLTPELGRYLREHALERVREAFAEYERVAPYWFVSRYEATYGEDVMHHLYDLNALFAVKALVFEEPRAELVRYLDVPAFARGDLFYILNLVQALEAP